MTTKMKNYYVFKKNPSLSIPVVFYFSITLTMAGWLPLAWLDPRVR